MSELKPQINDFKCIQLLSNDAALYYLLRKKAVLNIIMFGIQVPKIFKKNL